MRVRVLCAYLDFSDLHLDGAGGEVEVEGDVARRVGAPGLVAPGGALAAPVLVAQGAGHAGRETGVEPALRDRRAPAAVVQPAHEGLPGGRRRRGGAIARGRRQA